jgi:hypothetical protein
MTQCQNCHLIEIANGLPAPSGQYCWDCH